MSVHFRFSTKLLRHAKKQYWTKKNAILFTTVNQNTLQIKRELASGREHKTKRIFKHRAGFCQPTSNKTRKHQI